MSANPIERSQSEGTTASSEPSPRNGKAAAVHSRTVSAGSFPSGSGEVFDDTVIPPSHPYRTLVLCFDGTGDQFDADNSNIVEFFSMLKKDDRSQQMVYYQAGIGTYTVPDIATPLMAKVDKTMDEAIGNHLDAHVMAGYEFLMQNYQAQDKICLFGFSRGAYTARALAGMVHKVGLLPACNHQQVPFAYKMFTREDQKGWDQSNAFKKAFSVDVEIEFLGVWDTVNSVGIIPRRLPFTASNTAIRYFRHALALDEHRGKFKANHFQPSPPHVHNLGTKPGEMPLSNQKKKHPHSHYNEHHHDKKVSKKHFEQDYDDGQLETDVLEVWFAGCHCDVGGGSVANGTKNSLARIPLRWMIRQCFLTGSGIQFHRDQFQRIGLDPNSLDPIVQPRPPAISAPPTRPRHRRAQTEMTLVEGEQDAEDTGEPQKSEEEHDADDALMPIYDQLKIAKWWWLLEFIPIKRRLHQTHKLRWKHAWEWNLGHAREIPHKEGREVFIHRSVKIRMDADPAVIGQKKKYIPRPKLPPHTLVD